ncbi:MAG: DinB family protein [Thermoanaerobaculia bacterium]
MTLPSPKDQFLASYEAEHQTTMKVLRAFPPAQSELRPHPTSKTARELAFVFALERGLGAMVLGDAFASGLPPGAMPPAPEAWSDVLAAVEKGHQDFGALVRSHSEEKLQQTVKFFVGPRQLADWPRIKFLWFLLSDEIHHRGQFSVYLRMSGAKVPSIYGPSGDEPWF